MHICNIKLPVNAFLQPVNAFLHRGGAWIAAALLASVSTLCAAQGFPSKQVTLVVPNPPGGSIDIQARLYAAKLQEIWKQNVIVEYKAGGGTLIGMDFTAKSAPDGHTLCMAVTPLVILPALQPKMPYDTVKDLAGVTLTGVSSILIASSPTLAANNLAEVIALAKKYPGKLTYGTPGAGSSMHLAGELLKNMAGVDLLHVPFKGGAQAYPELMAGRIDLFLDPVFGMYRHVQAGKVKGIAVTSPKPDPSAPGIAPVAATLPGFSALSINGIVVPRATPRDIVRKLNADFITVLKMPDIAKRLEEFGLEVVGNSPEEFDAMIRNEIDRWTKVAKASNIKLD
ncbi:MAG: Bug family tripartite tricarboxylate transporter substrate binding protein [Burkholderiales bacterium]